MAARSTFTGGTRSQQQRVLEVLLLLGHSADVGLKENDNQTPLHTAVGNEETKVVQTLSGRTIEINLKDKEGKTPLHYAVICGHSEAVKVLLQEGGDLGIRDRNGNTPLNYAFYPCLDVGKILLENVELPAVMRNRREVLELLLNAGADVNYRDNGDETMLFYAVCSNSREVVELLLNAGADVNCRSNNGVIPFLYAVENNWRKVVELLLNAGADVNYKNDEGETPLINAVWNNSRKVVELLVNAGADVNYRNINGVTPLMYACSTHAMKLLLQKGAEVNAQDCAGRTTLHRIAEFNRRHSGSMVSELLDWGASLTIKDNSGKTPLDYESFTSSIMKHAIKRSCVNLHSEVGIDPLLRCEFPSFRDSCKEEVKRMKQEKFGKHSLYDIFRQYQDPRYLSNTELERGVKLSCLKEQFPIYDSLMKSTYTRAKERVDVCEVIADILETPLPREIIMYIFTFVDHDSLVNIIKATKETKNLYLWHY